VDNWGPGIGFWHENIWTQGYSAAFD